MNILSGFLKRLGKKAGQPEIAVHDESLSVRKHEMEMYGEQKLKKQKLYEKWACKESWLLYQEGMPLLFSVDPVLYNNKDEEISEKIEDLWRHARDCVHKKILSVLNIESHEREWRVRPVDFYCWATVSRISVPPELASLMQFILQTVKSYGTENNRIEFDQPEDTKFLKHKEIVLGAATCLLVNAPNRCKNNKGTITANLITRQILDNREQWFRDEEPVLAESAITDLINRYLDMGKPPVN